MSVKWKTKKCGTDEMDDDQESEYYQLEGGKQKTQVTEPAPRRLVEKLLFVMVSLTLVALSHMIVWAQWGTPLLYVIVTPLLVIIRAYNYWRYKWQYFMIDFCYFANALTLVFICAFPDDELLFRIVFALTNGPILVAAVVYRNSLVYHHHDKVTSVYIHTMPALTTFCIRWYPVESSRFWFQEFVVAKPELNLVWQFAVPFGFFFLHSMIYCLVVNVLMKPKEPYLTSYSYLAEKYEKLNCINGPMGQSIAYYCFNWLFCLSSLVLPLLSYQYFPIHCATITAVAIAVIWNGGSYYVHVFSERGFVQSGSEE